MRSTTRPSRRSPTAGYCSISHLQRQLKVGYNKAAKLVEMMEKDGVVGPRTARPAAGVFYYLSGRRVAPPDSDFAEYEIRSPNDTWRFHSWQPDEHDEFEPFANYD
jgi:hypothetical protein